MSGGGPVSAAAAFQPMAPGSWLCLPIDVPVPEPVDLTGADRPAYYVVPVDQRPTAKAEPAPYDLDVIRTDLEQHFGRGMVWTPFSAGQVIPARIAHLPRRPCTHDPACPRFDREGQHLVSPNWRGKWGQDR
jgi:hypothetical protein